MKMVKIGQKVGSLFQGHVTWKFENITVLRMEFFTKWALNERFESKYLVLTDTFEKKNVIE